MRLAVLLVLTIVTAFTAFATDGDTTDVNDQDRLFQELVTLGAEPMTEESTYLLDYVMRDAPDIEKRIQTFDLFFETYPFTEYHATNLHAHIVFSSASATRVTRFAASLSAAAIRNYWEHVATGPDSLTPALLFLEGLYASDGVIEMDDIADGINDALRGRPVPLTPHLRGDMYSSVDILVAAMQCCVTLAVFKEENEIDRWLEIPSGMAHFVNATDVWLFDGDKLSDAHRSNLESIFSAIPNRLHHITVLFVPDALPFTAMDTPLRLPGMAIDIPFAPTEMMRDLSEQPPYVPQPPVPEFTMMALEQVMRAIVASRLPERQHLAQRAAAVMHVAIAMPAAPLAQLAPQDVLMRGTPDMFLAYLGAQWLANSEALLEAAIMLAEQGVVEPLYAVLLVADLLSGGGDTTLLFHIGHTGALTASETALRRVFLLPTVSYVNGIALGGRIWQYDMTGIALLQ